MNLPEKNIRSMSDAELERYLAEQKVQGERFVESVKTALTATGSITQPEVFDIVADQIENAGKGLGPSAVREGLRALDKHYIASQKG